MTSYITYTQAGAATTLSPTPTAAAADTNQAQTRRVVAERQLAILEDALRPGHAAGAVGLELMRLRCMFGDIYIYIMYKEASM
jgi:hypothetical protein